METASLAAGLAGTLISLTALAVVFYVERVRGPKLQIKAGQIAPDPRGFEYVHIAVQNLPYRGLFGTGLLKGIFTRQVAIGCTVTLRILEPNSRVHPWTLMWSHAGQPEICGKPAPTLIPSASRWDVQPTGEDHLLPAVVHWPSSAETYAHDGWNFCTRNRDPAHRILPGTWTLVAIAASGQSRAKKTFRLHVPGVSGQSVTLEDPSNN